MRRTLQLFSAMIVVASVCAACTAGTPAPSPTTSAAPTAAPGAITLPPRPRDIPIDDIEPCSMLTRQQLDAVGLDQEPRSSTSSTSVFGDSRDCTVHGLRGRAVTLGIALITKTGIERVTRGGFDARISPITVSGFPAVLTRSNVFTDSCSVEIDIAQGQLIDVQFSDGGHNPPIPQDELCDLAQIIAGNIVASLLAR